MIASGPLDEGSILPEGWTWSEVGHGVLDIAGWVPGYGEAADLVNAAWYTGEEQYLEAGLSLISMAPIVGDVIGKGGKYAGKLSAPALKQLSRALQHVDFMPLLRRLMNHPTIGPKIGNIAEALERWRGQIILKARKSLAPCPDTAWKIDVDGWVGNVMESSTGRKMVAQFEADYARDPKFLAAVQKLDPSKRAAAIRRFARSKAQQAMESGAKEAIPFKVAAGDKLYKLTADGTSPTTPYWITGKQLEALKGKSPQEIANILGLPQGSIPRDGGPFLVQSITAKTNYTGFESTIAPVSNGAYKGAGGGKQVLVPARSNFSEASAPTVFK